MIVSSAVATVTTVVGCELWGHSRTMAGGAHEWAARVLRGFGSGAPDTELSAAVASE